MPLQITANTRPTANLRIAANQRARLSSVLSIDWDNITGKPGFNISEHAVAVGDGDGGFRGVSGAAGRVLTSNGAAADPSYQAPATAHVFNVSNYDSAQDAVDAAIAAHGGTVFFPAGTHTLSATLDLDDSTCVRLTGESGVASTGTQATVIAFSGSGSVISAKSSVGCEIDHLCIAASGASITKVIDFGHSALAANSSAISVHDNTIFSLTSNASTIGIDLDNTESAEIVRNTIAIVGGTGIRGVSAAGHYAIRAYIARNVFTAANMLVHIQSPGNTWVIENNTCETPKVNFLAKGPAGTANDVTLIGNWIGDVVDTGLTLVTSNASTLVSQGNIYANSVLATSSVCISQDNSTGNVTSIGDWLQADTGIAIGTGNTLSLQNPDRAHPPTTWITGSPGTSGYAGAFYGPIKITGAIDFNSSIEARIQTGSSTANSILGVGQGTSNSGFMFWQYSATPSSGRLMVGTTGNNNPVDIDGSAINIGVNASAAVNITNSGVAPNGTGAYVRTTSPALVTPALGTPASGVVTNLTGTASININGTVGATSQSTGQFTSLAYSTTLTGTSTNASALAVGRQGATNPVLQVDASTATVATGLKVKGAAAAGGLALSVITSGTNENLTLDAAGSGTITLGGTSTGGITLTRATTLSSTLALGGTVSGGGNQINNVVVGASTPLAGSFTSVSATSSIDLTNNQDANSSITLLNNSGGTSASPFYQASNGSNVIRFGMRGTAQSAYGALAANTAYIYGATDFTVMSDGGKVVFATGGNTERVRISGSGGMSIGTTTDAGIGALLTNTSIKSQGATAGIGYATGAGGTVTQITNRSTGVTLNTVSGAITLISQVNAAVNPATQSVVVVTNSAVAATDTVIVNQKSGTDKYLIYVTAVGAGSFTIVFYVPNGGTTNEAPVFNFNVIKGVTS